MRLRTSLCECVYVCTNPLRRAPTENYKSPHASLRCVHAFGVMLGRKVLRAYGTSLVKSGVKYFLHHLTTANVFPFTIRCKG